MDTPNYNKLKMKIGPNEFDAEGTADVVQEQFRAFKELVLETAALAGAYGSPIPTFVSPPASQVPAFDSAATPLPLRVAAEADESLNKIMRVDNRVVSLTVRARSLDDAVLLLVYGQKLLRNNDAVTGSEVMSGLAVSGLRVVRVDRQLVKAGETGDLIVVGIGRAKRYRLTNTGLTKARQLATDLIATVA